MKTHYETLKISQNATSEEIRKAYINLAKNLHPDKVKPEQRAKAKEVFINIKNAYNMIVK